MIQEFLEGEQTDFLGGRRRYEPRSAKANVRSGEAARGGLCWGSGRSDRGPSKDWITTLWSK